MTKDVNDIRTRGGKCQLLRSDGAASANETAHERRPEKSDAAYARRMG